MGRMLKVFRTQNDVFVLPLYNPERYWKLQVVSRNENLIGQLVEVFEEICDFKDLRDDEEDEDCSPNVSFEPMNRMEVDIRFAGDTDTTLSGTSPDSERTLEVSRVQAKSRDLKSLETTSSIDEDRTVGTVFQPILQQPIPIRPNSAESSLDSVLLRFEDEEDTGRPLSETGFNWMDTKSSQSEFKTINKRFSMTFKGIKPGMVIHHKQIESLRGVGEGHKLKGSDIVRNSFIMGAITGNDKNPSVSSVRTPRGSSWGLFNW
ncbi:hypothetical protein FOA43_000847 [Brettanomyces nanus]|uniref:Uncharacterized protein n=1 Tax=Eeniella nana TaxID=13502 RepID=A0A875RX23_EENNA|nr:uncharacterized protein FOA43_000847 [Brettanomyces nanus]QPG73536.1 hypothetical protein FOA43_000847 [Brettanomyces nanus]